MITKKCDLKVSLNLLELAKIFKKNNSTLYIVGGYVRDYLIGKNPFDIDICSRLKIEEVEDILKDTSFNFKVKNKSFGTAQIECDGEIYEYTCFRSEIYKNIGAHSPKTVTFVSSVVLDARRRDFYINSLYYNILEKEVLDPLCRGLKDLEDKKINVIEAKPHKFCEDATRIIRMFKFGVLLNFEIENLTMF